MLAERAALAAEELVSNTLGLHSEKHPVVTVAEQLVQAFVSVVFVSYVTLAHCRPIPVASVSVRVRECVSVPFAVAHVVEHDPQDVQRPIVQSVHAAPIVLHWAVPISSGHGIPLVSGTVWTFRVRDAVPVPQSESQMPHADQLETWQSVTQMFVLHSTTSDVVSGQGFAEAQGVVIVRVRLCEPVPQDVVHAWKVWMHAAACRC